MLICMGILQIFPTKVSCYMVCVIISKVLLAYIYIDTIVTVLANIKMYVSQMELIATYM